MSSTYLACMPATYHIASGNKTIILHALCLHVACKRSPITVDNENNIPVIEIRIDILAI